MRNLKQDLSIYKKFDFERSPVGVKFLYNEPEDIDKLGKSAAFCEMFKEAQERKKPFFCSEENHE